MTRPSDDSKEAQQFKYVAFRTAYKLVNQYAAEKNHIAAYVISFSILEDRIKALYVVWYMHTQNAKPSRKLLDEGFVKLVSKLSHHKVIASDLANQLRAEAEARNQLLHTAMWKLDAFTAESLTGVIALVRIVDKLLKDKKKEIASIPSNGFSV